MQLASAETITDLSKHIWIFIQVTGQEPQHSLVPVSQL